MIDVRSYLVRAWRDWIVDNGFTAYIVINCEYNGIELPKEFMGQDNLTLNISPSALKNFELTQDHLSFDARFDTISHHIFLPILSIQGIYAAQNNHGMWFNIDNSQTGESEAQNFTLGE